MSRCAAALALASGLASHALGADAHYRVVARTGQAAPGGGQFSTFGAPVVTPNGRVAFKGTVGGVITPTGLWSEGVSGMNNLQSVVREGQAVPGLAGTFFGSITTGSPIINAAGQVAFPAAITGAQAVFGDRGLFMHGAGGVSVIAAPGQTVSLPCGGLGCQRWLTEIDPYYFAFNSAGQAVFHADIDGTGVNSGNDHLVLMRSGAGLGVLLREGDAPPNTIDVLFTGGTWHQPLLNGQGAGLIRNHLVNPAGTAAVWSVWRGPPGGAGGRGGGEAGAGRVGRRCRRAGMPPPEPLKPRLLPGPGPPPPNPPPGPPSCACTGAVPARLAR
ncbi:MAG: hypothetical protein IBJ10_11705, partial [Phycisphaerales bacterium]|nr:hypothetical protein [Phycisphaerales bacterium]